MNPTRDFVRTSTPGLAALRSFTALPRLNANTLTRAGLPVVSNRTFINAWAARRPRVLAPAPMTRSN